MPHHKQQQGEERYSAAPPPRAGDDLSGVLVVDKPLGPTSHDIVDRIRKLFNIRKVGHGGTLDPMATGLLVILMGRATKLSGRFLGSDKAYTGTLRLGISTDSLDAAGEVTAEGDFSHVTETALAATMKAMQGDQMQEPPMVSAVKVNGVPLYKQARKGRVVERQSRLIHIYEFSLKRFEPPTADFDVRCTKGTYVRKLCADVGDTLGCGAHLAALRRTDSGDFTLDDAHPLSAITKLTREALGKLVIPMHQFTSDGKRIKR